MDDQALTADGPEAPPAHAGVRYALLRMVLLLVVGAALYLVGLRSWPLLFAAVLVSAVLSFFILLRQREAAARSLEASVSARSGRRRGAAEPVADASPASSGEPEA